MVIGVEAKGSLLDKPLEPVATKESTCPVHGRINFVEAGKTGVFVCPFPPETHGSDAVRPDDNPPGRPAKREGH